MFHENNFIMKSKTEKLLKAMNVIAWIVFIGLLIKVGTIAVTYGLSINNPKSSENLFGGINLLDYREYSFTQYTLIVFYKMALFIMEAIVAYLVIKLLSGLNLKTPFSETSQKTLQKISYSVFYLWIIAIIHNTHVQFLGKKHNFSMDLFSSDFIFLAAILFVFAQIMKRGIEIQSENDLTI